MIYEKHMFASSDRVHFIHIHNTEYYTNLLDNPSHIYQERSQLFPKQEALAQEDDGIFFSM